MSGEVENLSPRGAFIATTVLPKPGTQVRLALEWWRGKPIEVEGTVRWNTYELPEVLASGFGLEIHSPGERYLELYEKIRSLRSDPERPSSRRNVGKILVLVETDTSLAAGHLGRAALGSLFVRCGATPAYGEGAMVVVRDPEGPDLRLSGTVVPADPATEPGFHVQLDEVTEEYQQFYQRLLSLRS